MLVRRTLIVRNNVKSILRRFSNVKRQFSSQTPGSCITSTSELNQYLQKPPSFENYRVLDANWDLDDEDYKQMHFDKRICCSKFFSFEECRDVNSPFPRMLPPSDVFEDYVSELGISNDHHVIIYDNHENYGLYSSPRVWWMFRVFGHEKVTVLDGGLKQWLLDGFSTVSGEYGFHEILPKPKKKFKARFNPSLVRDFEFVEDIIESNPNVQITDARGGNRFAQGHIKGSISTPFPGMFLEGSRLLKNSDGLREYFQSKNINFDNDLVSSCGSGVTATIVALGIYRATGINVPVYDGSFSEWKERVDSDLIGKISD